METKPLPILPWINVSKDGVFTDVSKGGKEIKHNLVRLGKYPTITIVGPNKLVIKSWVSHLVALTWVDLPTDVDLSFLAVDYKDKNPENIHADNLVWVVGQYSNKSMAFAAELIAEMKRYI